MPKDFVRHVLNPLLGQAILEGRVAGSYVNEIRRQIERAEDKYNFSAYGGFPERLAEFIRSDDFYVLANTFKAAGIADVLGRALEEVRRSYQDYQDVVVAAEEALKQLQEQPRRPVSEVAEVLASVARDSRVEVAGNSARASIGQWQVVAEVKQEGVSVRVEGRFRFGHNELNRLREFLARLREV